MSICVSWKLLVHVEAVTTMSPFAGSEDNPQSRGCPASRGPASSPGREQSGIATGRRPRSHALQAKRDRTRPAAGDPQIVGPKTEPPHLPGRVGAEQHLAPDHEVDERRHEFPVKAVRLAAADQRGESARTGCSRSSANRNTSAASSPDSCCGSGSRATRARRARAPRPASSSRPGRSPTHETGQGSAEIAFRPGKRRGFQKRASCVAEYARFLQSGGVQSVSPIRLARELVFHPLRLRLARRISGEHGGIPRSVATASASPSNSGA